MVWPLASVALQAAECAVSVAPGAVATTSGWFGRCSVNCRPRIFSPQAGSAPRASIGWLKLAATSGAATGALGLLSEPPQADSAPAPTSRTAETTINRRMHASFGIGRRTID